MLAVLIVFLVTVAIFVWLAVRNPRDNNHEGYWQVKRRDEFRDGF